MSEPLTEEQLREYREHADRLDRSGFYSEGNVAVIRALLAEVERLRAERAAYLATPEQLVTLIRAGEAVARDAMPDEDDDVCEVDSSRIRFLESALDDIGPIPEELL